MDLRDHPKPEGKPAEVGKGPSIRPKEHSLSRYWVITSECCLADSMFEDAERSGEPPLEANSEPKLEAVTQVAGKDPVWVGC